MEIFLLCLIVAILLFGSSRVIGAFGKVLGLIVFVIGIASVSKVVGLTPEILIGGILLLILLGSAYFAIFHPEEWKEAKKQNKEMENIKKK